MGAKERRILLLSSSVVYGSEYLQHAADDINTFLKKYHVSRILFVPYALHDYDGYTNKVTSAFEKWVRWPVVLVKLRRYEDGCLLGCSGLLKVYQRFTGPYCLYHQGNDRFRGYKVNGIHTSKDPVQAVKQAEAFYVGGGNTFQLLKALYDWNLIDPIRKHVLEEGVPYIGSSAGTNVATPSICTTNDMPIVYPPSFTALGLIPFNINPHYLDASPTTHMGETREQRIEQYHKIPGVPSVVGLREGSLLLIEGDKITLKGKCCARVFSPGRNPEEHEAGSDLSFLLKTV